MISSPRLLHCVLSKPLLLMAGLILTTAAPALAQVKCANPNAIGVSRTVEIDNTGGPGFGLEYYKEHDFLQPREVVLTFDDGPQVKTTDAVLAALADQCTKAVFFSIGKMALGLPDLLRHVSDAGMTIGTHTWSHALLRKSKTEAEAIDEIERGMSAVKRAVGPTGNVVPFFRYPGFQDTPATLAYLQKRNVSIWATDIDSLDFKIHSPDQMVKSVIAKLEKKGKGIVLMHDIHKWTAEAVPMLLVQLKEHGFKIVEVRSKGKLQTLPEFDTAIEASVKGLAPAGSERPTSMVVRTISGGDGKSNLGAEPPAPAAAEQILPPPAIGTPAVPRGVVATPNADGDAAKGDRRWFWQQK